MTLLITSAILAALLTAGGAAPDSYGTIKYQSSPSAEPDTWGKIKQVAAIPAVAPAQHYYYLYGGHQPSWNGGGSGSGETKTVSYTYASPAITYAAPAAVEYHQPAPVQEVRYSSKWSHVSHDDALDAHRRAVEEHQRAHAEALRRLDDARRSHKVKVTQHSSSGHKQQDDDSGEKYAVRAYGTPQVVLHQSEGYNKVYTGPKVTREETEILHHDAISKLRGMSSLQKAIAAKGPAKADPNYREPSWSNSDSSDDSSDSNSGEKKYYYPQQVHVAAAPQEVTYQYYEQKPYTGPKVTREEAEYLHRDAIAKQKELIRKQAALIARGSDSSDDDDSSDETKDQDNAQLSHDQQKERALLAQQEAEVQAQILVAKQQGEHARIAGPIEGAYRDDWSSSEEGGNYQGGSHGGAGDSSESGESRKYAFVPVYHAPSVPAWGGHGGSAKQSSGEVYKYSGPKVTKEETERLHADAINKQRAIIAQHEAFVARQKTALETRYSYHKSSGDDSSESGGSKKGGYSYASGYYAAAPVAVPQTVNVVGPAVTNYVSGWAPASAYVSGSKSGSYVQKAGGVYSSGDSGESQHKKWEDAELARQDALVRAQIQLAKEQGAAAAADGKYWKSAASKSSGEAGGNSQYVYYRYAAPTFGYYAPAIPKQEKVVYAAPVHHVPSAVYVQSATSGNSGEDDGQKW